MITLRDWFWLTFLTAILCANTGVYEAGTISDGQFKHEETAVVLPLGYQLTIQRYMKHQWTYEDEFIGTAIYLSPLQPDFAHTDYKPERHRLLYQSGVTP
jgi:hypothetical protein